MGLIVGGVVLVLDVRCMSGTHHIWRVILGLLYYGQLLHKNSLICVVHATGLAALTAALLTYTHTYAYFVRKTYIKLCLSIATRSLSFMLLITSTTLLGPFDYYHSSNS